MFEFNNIYNLNNSRLTIHLLVVIKINLNYFPGYKYMFNDKLVTIWSAPNYCYRCGNIASIMKFSSVHDRKPILFNAVPDDQRVIPDKAATPYFL